MPRSTSWLWPVMSLLSLKTGLRRTALRRETAPTELWTMRKMASHILTLSSTLCCSLHRSTSWWHSPTGIGRFHAVGDLSSLSLYFIFVISWVLSTFSFKVGHSSIVGDVTFALLYISYSICGVWVQIKCFVFLLRYIIWIESTSPLCLCVSAALTPTMRPSPASGRLCGWRSPPAGSASHSMCGHWWLHWSWSIGTLTETAQCPTAPPNIGAFTCVLLLQIKKLSR